MTDDVRPKAFGEGVHVDVEAFKKCKRMNAGSVVLMPFDVLWQPR